MYHYFHSEKSNYIHLLESICTLTKSITDYTKTIRDFTISQKRQHEVFLHSFPSQQPQNQHPSSQSPQSDQPTVATVSEPPKLPTLIAEHHYAVLDSSSIPDINEKVQKPQADTMNVVDRGLAVTDGVHRRRETIVVDTSNVGTGINHSKHPLRLTLLGSTTSSSLRVASMVFDPTIRGSVTSTLFGKLGHGFSTLVPTTVRQLVTPTAIPSLEKTALHITSATPHSLSGFVLDPGGFPSVLCHLLHMVCFCYFAAFDFSSTISASLFVVAIRGVFVLFNSVNLVPVEASLPSTAPPQDQLLDGHGSLGVVEHSTHELFRCHIYR